MPAPKFAYQISIGYSSVSTARCYAEPGYATVQRRRLSVRLTDCLSVCDVQIMFSTGFDPRANPVAYTADIVRLVESFGSSELQPYTVRTPTTHKSTVRRVTCGIAAVADWMRSNRLQLNTGKTEFMWTCRQHQLPTDQLAVGSDLISPVSFVRDLGI